APALGSQARTRSRLKTPSRAGRRGRRPGGRRGSPWGAGRASPETAGSPGALRLSHAKVSVLDPEGDQPAAHGLPGDWPEDATVKAPRMARREEPDLARRERVLAADEAR